MTNVNILSTEQESSLSEINCTVFKIVTGQPISHCEGKVAMNYDNFTKERLAQNNGEFYDKISCDTCGMVHTVIPWAVLTLDQKNAEGQYEYSCDYYILPHHKNGMLTTVSEDRVERTCPDGCGSNISFSTNLSKEKLEQNNGEFYEAIKCGKCETEYKTIPWIAVVNESERKQAPDGLYSYPAWIL